MCVARRAQEDEQQQQQQQQQAAATTTTSSKQQQQAAAAAWQQLVGGDLQEDNNGSFHWHSQNTEFFELKAGLCQEPHAVSLGLLTCLGSFRVTLFFSISTVFLFVHAKLPPPPQSHRRYSSTHTLQDEGWKFMEQTS
jgi:hypothetical protein